MTTDPWKVGTNLVFDLDRSPVLGRLMIVMRRTDGRSVPGFRDGACPLVTFREETSEEEVRELVDRLNRHGDMLAVGRLCPEHCAVAPGANRDPLRRGDPSAPAR